MPPGELPASLVAGKPHPTLNTSGYGGSYHSKNTPTSPEDSLIPFDSPTTRTAGNHSPLNHSPLNHSPLSQEDIRSGRGLEPEQPGFRDRSAARDRSRPNGRPHTKSPGSSRLCQKCNEPLTGQFVRALGGTFHLECFKCDVSTLYGDGGHWDSDHELTVLKCRTAVRLSPPSSSPSIRPTAASSTLSAKPTISDASVCFATSAAAPYAGRISRH